MTGPSISTGRNFHVISWKSTPCFPGLGAATLSLLLFTQTFHGITGVARRECACLEELSGR